VVSAAGKKWRREWNENSNACTPPLAARNHWRTFLQAWNSGLDDIPEDARLAALNLMAISDEASQFAGFPSGRPGRAEGFSRDALIALKNGSWATLCNGIHGSKIAVLPKSHTPQTGFTLRSLSHNLALCPGSEMRPVWRSVPIGISTRLNLLIIPWPAEVKPGAFRTLALPWHGVPAKYGYFTYTPGRAAVRMPPARFVRSLVEKASVRYRIDGVVFPELSLTRTEYDNVRALIAPTPVAGKPAVRFLLGGVGEPSLGGVLGKNELRFDLVLNNGTKVDSFVQRKHHRWQLNASQMDRYRLGGSFKRTHLYWESIEMSFRDLNILALDPYLTMSVLICEDLARPDPVGDLLRAVGPNLIISLLADAPQLPERWPGRYAAAFAEDPGSSVLTLTSLGMCQLDTKCVSQKRIIALWAQEGRSPQPLLLPDGADGMVLELSIGRREEFSADGRTDHGTAGHVTLLRHVPISLAV
jgi:hypothetical protein